MKKNIFRYAKNNLKVQNNYKLKILLLSLVVAISLYCNYIYPFPHFAFFLCIFMTIGIGAFWAIQQFDYNIKKIIALTAKEPPCERARIVIQKYEILKINYIIPVMVILVFGIGGCIIFSKLQITPTFFCCILIFIPVVYISIKGYLRYIYLCMFIFRIAFSDKKFKHLPLMRSANVPPVINWYKKLENLFIFYQGAFFLLGLLYIIAFSKFCFSPEYGVYIDGIIFFILWGIIFLAIVVTFPIVVALEMHWMKKIEEKMLEFYFLKAKKDIFAFEEEHTFSEIFADIIRKNVISEIMVQSKKNIKNVIFIGYSRVMSVINFIVSIITIVEFYKDTLSTFIK